MKVRNFEPRLPHNCADDVGVCVDRAGRCNCTPVQCALQRARNQRLSLRRRGDPDGQISALLTCGTAQVHQPYALGRMLRSAPNDAPTWLAVLAGASRRRAQGGGPEEFRFQ